MLSACAAPAGYGALASLTGAVGGGGALALSRMARFLADKPKKSGSAPSHAENTNTFVREALSLLDYPERLQTLLLKPQVGSPCSFCAIEQ